METEHLSRYVRAAISRYPNAGGAALACLRAADATQAMVAESLKIPATTVSGWFAIGKSNRPIPVNIAEILRTAYEIPLSAWVKVGKAREFKLPAGTP